MSGTVNMGSVMGVEDKPVFTKTILVHYSKGMDYGMIRTRINAYGGRQGMRKINDADVVHGKFCAKLRIL